MSRTIRMVGLLLLGLAGNLGAQTASWGSFDNSRINYSDGMLTGSAHSTLRGIITANGGSFAAPAATLTDAYLGGVDVFYTSLLNTSTGTLSASEQTSLQNWVNDGGTLIVTADIFPLSAYESFTSFFGVTGYTAPGHTGVGHPVASHPITQGVSTYGFATNGSFTLSPYGALLGTDDVGGVFMEVLEEATGFTADGRVLVVGDHNMFTDLYIGSNDNARLAANIASWAAAETTATPEPSTVALLAGGLLLLVVADRGRRMRG